MRCTLCGSTSFRLSRLRVADLLRMAIFQYPVRCRLCSKRAFMSFPLALKVGYQDKLRHRERQGKSGVAPRRA
jgi:hypothetical protein